MMSGSLVCLMVAGAALFSAVIANEDPQPVVDTQYGRLLGTLSKSYFLPTVTQMYAFRGIPYAMPPVGDLRLALAEPTEPWEGDRDATEPGNSCPQNIDSLGDTFKPLVWPLYNVSEDCLYLDVYTPDLTGKRDVLFFIHGGGFQMGSGSGLNGTVLAALGDIVVVSINYRLGLLGFLPNYDGNWPSNLGIRDQQFALRWVQDNIAAFGGDPDKVTIAGESAGAMSVSAHILAPSSQGLFLRAIMQSGSVFLGTVDAEAPTSATLQTLGCDDLDADGTLACLRNKSTEEFLQAPLVPNQIDDEIFFNDPTQEFADGRLGKVDLLVGVTGDEGYILVDLIVPELTAPEPDREKIEEQMRGFSSLFHPGEVHEQIMQHYFADGLADMEPDQMKQTVAKIIGNQILTAPTYLAAQLHSDHVANTYFYEFEYRPSFVEQYRPAWHTKCDHGFDLLLTYGAVLMDSLLEEGTEVSEEDIAVTKIAVKYWTNFIKTGNPNGDGLVEWKPFTRQEDNYLILKPECEPASNFQPEDMIFWNTKIRDLDKPVEEPDSGREEL